jgi:hypothetical protein
VDVEASAEVQVQLGAPVAAPVRVVSPAPVAVQIVTPASTPVQVAYAAPVRSRPSVMANRWAVGFSIGSMSLAPDSAPDSETEFATGELALRFRATRHLELEVSAGGGREQTADEELGDLEVATVALSARYRFRPEARWNWFLMGGIGAASVTHHDATDEQREQATQPLGMLGIGVERRFRRFAIQAEARGVGMAERKDDDMDVVDVARGPIEGPIEVPSRSADQARSGGSLTVGLSYYF